MEECFNSSMITDVGFRYKVESFTQYGEETEQQYLKYKGKGKNDSGRNYRKVLKRSS